MKIATLNIDWSKKLSQQKTENFLQQFDFDFLILTEAIPLNLQNYNCIYYSDQIPTNQVYEGLNYTKYLNGKAAFRTIIYSKIPAINKFELIDNNTSLAMEFKTTLGNIVIYATIIGTWFKKQPYAKNELLNCINDCEKIYSTNQNIFIVGDLNTSFQENEKEYTINEATTESLKLLFTKLNLVNATKQIEKNIDHIIIPKSLKDMIIGFNIFVEKDILSDHKGVYINLRR